MKKIIYSTIIGVFLAGSAIAISFVRFQETPKFIQPLGQLCVSTATGTMCHPDQPKVRVQNDEPAFVGQGYCERKRDKSGTGVTYVWYEDGVQFISVNAMDCQ